MQKEKLLAKCREILKRYQVGEFGKAEMPEEAHPSSFASVEERVAYFTLPMALNYQRDSYKLWQAALKTYEDASSRWVFDVGEVARREVSELREHLLKYKLALQPNKHVETWYKISKNTFDNFKNISNIIQSSNNDFLKLKMIIQKEYKSAFPYLSGPKIFNYWCYILGEYAGVKLINTEYIDIAPDTHVIKGVLKKMFLKLREFFVKIKMRLINSRQR